MKILKKKCCKTENFVVYYNIGKFETIMQRSVLK